MNLKYLCVNYVCKLCCIHPSSLSTRLRSSFSSSVDKVSLRQNGGRQSVPTMKWLATKCPCDEMAGNELYPWRNGWWQIVSATKWQATKRRRQNDGDERCCTQKFKPNRATLIPYFKKTWNVCKSSQRFVKPSQLCKASTLNSREFIVTCVRRSKFVGVNIGPVKTTWTVRSEDFTTIYQ